MPKPKIEKLKADMENAKFLVESGMSYQQIATRYDVTTGVVSHFARIYVRDKRPGIQKLKLNTKQKQLLKDKDKIKQDILNGIKYEDIAVRYQCSINTLNTFCRNHKIRKSDLTDYRSNNKSILYSNQVKRRKCICCGIRDVPTETI
jgi:transposase